VISSESSGEKPVEPAAVQPRAHEAVLVERIADQLPEIDPPVHLELTMMR